LNIVFDLGGVVLRWEPDKIIADVFAETELQARVRADIFAHQDWLELDRGTLPLGEAVKRGAARSEIPAARIAMLFDEVPHALQLIPETVDLIYRLKSQGHRLYYLSNMHVASIEHLEREYTFWNAFEGGVISCRVHLIKPEPEIYRTLLERYALDGAETVFIDDREINLTAAAEFGIRTIHFKNPEQCAEQLHARGIVKE
jgi:putative hydrolase of the HAD superfamily